MKSPIAILVSSCLLFAVNAAQAQPMPPEGGGLIQGPSPGVTALDRFAMSISELGAFQGQFQLVDGRTLSVTRRNRTLFAKLIGQPPVELVPKSGNTFVSVKGAIHLKFQQAQNGNVSGVEMRSVGRTG